MTNFKIVPVEPTEEMLRVACDEEQRPLPMWTRMKAIYTATLAEAPVINIVATKNEQGQIVSVTLQDEDHRILEVIAESDVQGEPVGRVKTVGGYPDESEHTVEWLCKYRDLKDGDLLYTAPQPAEKQPDVSALVEALEGVVSEIERVTCLHENTHRGGVLWEICEDCGTKWADDRGGKPEFSWPDSVEKARTLIAAHRKGGGK